MIKTGKTNKVVKNLNIVFVYYTIDTTITNVNVTLRMRSKLLVESRVTYPLLF